MQSRLPVSDQPVWIVRLLVVLCISIFGAIIYFALFSSFSLPDRGWLRGRNDDVLHFLAFGALTVSLVLLLKPWLSFIVTIVAAAAIEFVQISFPNRTASIGDFLAGFAGAFVIASIAHLIRRAER